MRKVYVVLDDTLLNTVRKQLGRLATITCIKPHSNEMFAARYFAEKAWRVELQSDVWPEGPYGLAFLTVSEGLSFDRLETTATLRIDLPALAETEPAV